MSSRGELVNGQCLVWWSALPSAKPFNVYEQHQDWPIGTSIQLNLTILNSSFAPAPFYALLSGAGTEQPIASNPISLPVGVSGQSQMEFVLPGPQHDLKLQIVRWEEVVNEYDYKIGYTPSVFESILPLMVFFMMIGIVMKMLHED